MFQLYGLCRSCGASSWQGVFFFLYKFDELSKLHMCLLQRALLDKNDRLDECTPDPLGGEGLTR